MTFSVALDADTKWLMVVMTMFGNYESSLSVLDCQYNL